MINITLNTTIRIVILYSFLLVLSSETFAQITTVQGVVKDSITGTPISFATIRFADSSFGGLSDDDGKFKLSNNQDKNVIICTLMGYNTKSVTIPIGKKTSIEILLNPEGVNLKEIVIRPQKEKYSKKNNPAVELIKKVIEHKHDYLASNKNYYQNTEYDRIFFAINEFDIKQPQYKKLQFLAQYTDRSKIDDKLVLPFSLRETLSSVYYQKKTKETKRIIKAYKNEGLDQAMDTEGIDAIIAEVFKSVSITDNNINLLFHDFVGPLNEHTSVNFYKWYIIDTVSIDQKKFINLGFVPFNPRDVGFSGNIFVANDSTYAIKRVAMRVPTKVNVNFVKEMIVKQEFEQLSPDLWIPREFITAIDISLYGTVKLYVEKIKNFDDFIFDQPTDSIFINPAPEIYLANYNKQNKDYWNKNRPNSVNKDYQMDKMMEGILSNKFIDITLKTANILSTTYIATSKDSEKNKVDLGTTLTFYSYNPLEGNRFRLTAATNKNFHPNIFLYGYLAYGTRDNKFKYMSEATWAFNERKYHKDEFPKNNISIAYKYDINALGQRFLQAERDNILLSGSSNKNQKLTYDKMFQLSYIKEYYNGFSVNSFAVNHNEEPAGNLIFERKDKKNVIDTVDNLKTTELGLILRYATNEKFFQQRRLRRRIPANGTIYTLSHSVGLKNIFGSHYGYHKSSIAINNELRVPPFGRLLSGIQAEKVWGTAPFPLLLSPNANNSHTVQTGSFYLLRPLEFISDSQVSWDISLRMGGWLFNRIPVIKNFGWREILAFRGFIGTLSEKNNPEYNRDLLIFPSTSFSMTNTPYMEYTLGIANILKFFRIDYVRRLNYLDNPDINKDGFRFSFDMRF